MKQQSEGKHVAPLWDIILIPSQPFFALTTQWCVLSADASNTTLIGIYNQSKKKKKVNKMQV